MAARKSARGKGAKKVLGRVAPRSRARGREARSLEPDIEATAIQIHAFRGVREIAGRGRADWTNQEREEVAEETTLDPLLWAGHVGVSFDGGRTIYGFTPELPERTRADEFLSRLAQHEAFPGLVLPDTKHFADADRLAAESGWNTSVVVVSVLVGRDEKRALQKTIEGLAEAADSHGEFYAFPLKQPQPDGPIFAPSNRAPPDKVSNCSEFLLRHGVPLPKHDGSVIRLIALLEQWEADSPIDRREGSGERK